MVKTAPPTLAASRNEPSIDANDDNDDDPSFDGQAELRCKVNDNPVIIDQNVLLATMKRIRKEQAIPFGSHPSVTQVAEALGYDESLVEVAMRRKHQKQMMVAKQRQRATARGYYKIAKQAGYAPADEAQTLAEASSLDIMQPLISEAELMRMLQYTTRDNMVPSYNTDEFKARLGVQDARLTSGAQRALRARCELRMRGIYNGIVVLAIGTEGRQRVLPHHVHHVAGADQALLGLTSVDPPPGLVVQAKTKMALSGKQPTVLPTMEGDKKRKKESRVAAEANAALAATHADDRAARKRKRLTDGASATASTTTGDA